MAFPMIQTNLYDYDVYPKIVRAGCPAEITIRPTGGRQFWFPGQEYDLTIKALFGGNPAQYPDSGCYETRKVRCDEDGCLRIRHTFEKEQEYFLDVAFADQEGRPRKERFSVYCVAEDLWGMYTLMGDLHVHTTRSDGSQNPATVCANYRRHGYDFMVISDHRRYYPSLEAIRAYEDVPTELCIVPGEEVHMPLVHGRMIIPHIVNFGGNYSINALVDRDDVEKIAQEPENRCAEGECPPMLSQEAFEQAIDAKAAEVAPHLPEGVDSLNAGGVEWIFDQIRKAGGLGVYPHPTWISDTFHVPDVLHRYIVDHRLFDAFEVLGGENYFEQNGYQTVQYYEDRALGHRYPVVGSTDSHSSYPTNRNAYICSTIVFAPENNRQALIDAIKDFRSVAVDTISAEFRLVGEMRLVRYGCFLLKNYFPLHDEACAEEGRLMKQAVTGAPEEQAEARRTLSVLHGRMARMRQKYFAF